MYWKIGDILEGEANGYYTRMLGNRLDRLIKAEFSGQYRIYYDHKVVDPDSIITQLVIDNQAENLSEIDLAIVSTRHDGERLCLVSEIEEHKHTPKRLLGDIAAIMMADQVLVDGHKHPLENVVILLGFVTRKGGGTGPRAERYTSRFVSMISEGIAGKRGVWCIVLSANDGEQLVNKVEECVKSHLCKGFEPPTS